MASGPFQLQKQVKLGDSFHLISNSADPSAELKDEIVWKKWNQDVFPMSSAVITNFQANQRVEWCKMIWLKGNIKKHSVCAWLAIQNAPKTKQWLASELCF